MLQATWDWYYGANENELLEDCQFGEPFLKDQLNDSESKVIIRPGTYENGDAVNIFTSSRKNEDNFSYMEVCIQHLKLLRHPNILRFISCIPLEIEYHLITEHAYPLATLLDVVDAHEICSGFHDIALALQFIHDKAHVTHNHICIESIFVHDSGPWKLGGFGYACHYEEATAITLQKNPSYMKPPEEKEPNSISLPLKKEHGHCRDVYMFGMLLEEFHEKIMYSTARVKNDIQDVIDDMTREDYENRPTFKEILTMPIFKSTYISIVHFLQSITLRSKSEKEEFFKSLLTKLDESHVFAEVTGRRIVPLLFTPIVLAEPSALTYVIKDILTPSENISGNGVLPESIFARYMIPKLVELFKSRLLHVRIVLLENFSKFAHLFESSILKEMILPEILLGLNDANNQVVQFSLHALADAVAVIGADLIVGSEREKIFSLATPKFDGCVLNESRTLAYEEKIPKRKKVEKKLPTPEPRKPTLLELALMNKSKERSSPAPTVEILLKQKQLAHQIAEKSLVTSNNHIAHSGEKKSSSAQVMHQPDVETWASSEEESSDTAWPDIDDDSYVDGDSLQPNSSDDTSLHQTSTSISEGGHRNPSRNSPILSPSTTDDKLGTEFEIKVQNTRRSKAESDFFEDMLSAAQLPMSPPAFANDATSQQRSNKEEQKSSKTTITSAFSALDVDDQESGWSDDGWD